VKILGNILWFIFGGFWSALIFFIIGLLWCVTIIGIPVGLQAFKAAKLTLAPFGKEVVYGGGAGKLLLNILWIILGGLVCAINCVIWGLLMFVTIIGIPFGIQYFKLAKLALMPFGATIQKNGKSEKVK